MIKGGKVMKRPELLSPAGDREKLETAIGPPNVIKIHAKASPLNPIAMAKITAINGIRTSLAKTVTNISFAQFLYS